jgi:hypothetical protein
MKMYLLILAIFVYTPLTGNYGLRAEVHQVSLPLEEGEIHLAV